jgi:hypothetical protein
MCMTSVWLAVRIISSGDVSLKSSRVYLSDLQNSKLIPWLCITIGTQWAWV